MRVDSDRPLHPCHVEGRDRLEFRDHGGGTIGVVSTVAAVLVARAARRQFDEHLGYRFGTM